MKRSGFLASLAGLVMAPFVKSKTKSYDTGDAFFLADVNKAGDGSGIIKAVNGWPKGTPIKTITCTIGEQGKAVTIFKGYTEGSTVNSITIHPNATTTP